VIYGKILITGELSFVKPWRELMLPLPALHGISFSFTKECHFILLDICLHS